MEPFAHSPEENDTQQALSRGQTDTWLIVAHCFNMDGRAASQTITDRLPQLMASGIEPVVLSAPTGNKDRRFPHYRMLSLAPSGFLFEMRHIIRLHVGSRAGQRFLKTLLTLICLPFYILEKIFVHLDSQWSWFVGATLRGLPIVHRHRPSLIYSTAGPPSTHLVGFLLQKLCRLPWLAEIHDPLIYDEKSPRWQNYWFKRWIERLVSRHADAVIYFTEQALASARKRHPFAGSTHVLRPGAAAPEISSVAYVPGPTLHLGHFGSLSEERNLAAVMRALHELLTATPRWRELLRLDVYGADLDPASRRALHDSPLPDTVAEHGRLEYDPETGKSGRQQVMEAMRRCDLLLLIHGSGYVCDQYIPSKLYEYLFTRRPILGIAASGSELDRILQANGHTTVAPDDIEGLKKTLATLIDRWESTGLPDINTDSPYTIAAAVSQLLQIADATKCGGQAKIR